ncbi:MAG: hypothetical protein ACNYPE_06985 [Candidatus Azotimanducaceae bacterium WSBS_2022_MAG_OTU7]
MTLLNLSRIAPDRDEFQAQGPACMGCSGCADRPRVVSLAQISGDSAVLELALTSQWVMLWNSWIKPLLATVIAAAGCDNLGLSETLTVGVTLTAFLAGYLVCHVVPLRALKISENLS